MPVSQDLRSRLLEPLTQLYGEGALTCLGRVVALGNRYAPQIQLRESCLWDERDVVLITYGDQLSGTGWSPLACLQRFLLEHQLNELVTTLHILPFFPHSSDDGFAVIDYREVDPAVGSWPDIGVLSQSFDLMFDLVLNHCSTHHRWFQDYLVDRTPGSGYFIEADPRADYSLVARPRCTPLLTPFQTGRGERQVWTTFSDDQVDLNWRNPDVLLEMLDTLLFYVCQGARIIRLDAVAYLWKTLGTACIHLPEAHAAIKVMRILLDALAPGRLLLTETNVPHHENVSYFGEGDEAHMVYQFSLPPLLLDAFVTGDAQPLMDWLRQLEPSPPGTTFLNFTASHDGIGLRPLEDLISPERLDCLVSAVRATGGMVSTRHKADGTDSPYELNVSYFSALGRPGLPTASHVRRFLATQAVMLTLRGIPAIYFHSLVGTPNDVPGFQRTGRARTINRRKFDWDELQSLLTPVESVHRQVFDGYRRMLSSRVRQPAFHPDAAQEVVDLDSPSVISFVRTSVDGRQRILVVTNVADTTTVVHVPQPFEQNRVRELFCMGTTWQTNDHLSVSPAGVAWLTRTE